MIKRLMLELLSGELLALTGTSLSTLILQAKAVPEYLLTILNAVGYYFPHLFASTFQAFTTLLPFLNLVEIVQMLTYLLVKVFHGGLLLLLFQEGEIVVVSVFAETVPGSLLLLTLGIVGSRTWVVVLFASISETFLGLRQPNPLLQARLSILIRAWAQKSLTGWREPLRAQT
jgi:hypothetical protein